VRRLLVTLGVGAALLAAGWREAGTADRSARGTLDDRASQDAAGAAARFAQLTAHLRSSSGDRRFADRLEADPPVVEELLADIAMALHQGLHEEGRLVRFEVLDVRAEGIGLAAVRAKEFWITRITRDGRSSARSEVVEVTYAMRQDAGGWRVADWVIDQARPAAGQDDGP
jgi:hypothetical protein